MSDKAVLKKLLAVQSRLPPEFNLLAMSQLHPSQLPDQCILWRGAYGKQKPQVRRYNTAKGDAVLYPIHDRPRARWNGQPGEKLVWEFVVGPVQGHLKNGCGNFQCMNPRHWKDVGERKIKPKDTQVEAEVTPEIPDEITLLRQQFDALDIENFADALDEFMDLYSINEIADACRNMPLGPQPMSQLARRWNITEDDLRAICSEFTIR